MGDFYMLRRYRRRHGYPGRPYAALRYIVLGLLCGLAVVMGGKKIASLINQVGSTQTVAAVLSVPNRSSVQVSLDGGDPQRAENGLRLYPGDRLTVGGNAQGFVTFFDGSIIGLDENAELVINESIQGEASSTIEISLTRGTFWFHVPSTERYDANIHRSLRTPHFLVDLPPQAEGLMTDRTLKLFTGDGLGGRIEIPDVSAVGYVGEGQQFSLPADEPIQDDLYRYRSPLDESAEEHPLVIAGRLFAGQSAESTEEQTNEAIPIVSSDEILNVTAPVDGSTVEGNTVQVEGSVGKNVRRIRINGYMVNVTSDDSTFVYELDLPRDPEVSIVIEALDDKGISLVGLERTVRRDIDAPLAPTILLPSGSGTTYRTQRTELEISGLPPPDAVGIMVNDYRLQLFVQGDPQWSYLASLELGNLEYGRNVYEVRAIDTSGNVSPAVVITILLEEGEEGIVGGPNEMQTTQKTEQQPSSNTLSDNPPLLPGSLRIIGPTVGEPFTATGSEFSIYGIAPEEAYSIWVNGYRLRFYKPGEPVWKYIASYPLGTMKRGKNVYDVVLRNRQGEILDRLSYTVYYRVD